MQHAFEIRRTKVLYLKPCLAQKQLYSTDFSIHGIMKHYIRELKDLILINFIREAVIKGKAL